MNKIEVIPLGGIGEFGANSMAICYADEMIVVDAGMGFPEESAYGVDICIPDFDFLERFRDKLTALVITHGHEDHIGGTAYFLKKFNLPVYASRLTAAMIDNKLDEHNLLAETLVHRVSARQKVKIGDYFKVEFINVTHSIPDCFALAIETPAGTIIHSGDFKIDETPILGKPTDLQRLREYGERGVLALLADSTNATVTGRTPSERAVIPAFEEIISQAHGRVIVSTFSSSLHRVQIILDTAAAYGRKVCVLGRSMTKAVELAESLGILRIPYGTLVSLSEAKHFDDEELVLIVTGSQGEGRAALWQMATNTYKGWEIEPNDTVILSARIIPGNEKNISRLIGNLYKRGANIIEESRRLIHVSGHASQEDIKIMAEAVRPKFIVPIHGEYRMLFRHKEFVRNHLGYQDENIILFENGDVLEITPNFAHITAHNEIGRIFIDESGFEEIDIELVRQRKQTAFNGVISILLIYDGETLEIIEPPQISAKGVLRMTNGNEAFVGQLQGSLKQAFAELSAKDKRTETVAAEHLRVAARRFIQKATNSKPVVMVNVVEI